MPSIKEIAKSGVMLQTELLIKDTKYIPEEKFAFCPMGCAKTARDIMAETANVNVMLAKAFTGAGKDAEFGTRVDQASTLADLAELVRESASVVIDAIDSLGDADLEKEVTMPWGARYPLWQAIFLPTSHMTYHDGQINYIQTLLGDSAFHWME
jgi:uncharacterized damage-inducible protein DinB